MHKEWLSRVFDVLSVRQGFATNSSSSHSIVFSDTPITMDDDPGGEYGWNQFVLGSVQSKRNYLAHLIYYSLHEAASADIAKTMAREWACCPDFDPSDGYIDHQSVFGFPRDWKGHMPSGDFIKQFREYMESPHVAVFGGNDNSGSMDIPKGMTELGIPWDSGAIARLDDKYKYWALFCRSTGQKVRIRFKDAQDVTCTPDGAKWPELVDIKITDACNKGCAFCYQDSKVDGEHVYDIGDLVYALSQLQVFEVALGGGEPTLHPHFMQILRLFRTAQIVPNFSTRSVDWLFATDKRQQILKTCGAFAFSVDSLDECKQILRAFDKLGVPTQKASIQLIIGVVPTNELYEIFRLCAQNCVRVTLLGYKTKGRGASYKTGPTSTGWLDAALKVHDENRYWFRLGVDTVLAAQSDKALQQAGVDKRFYETIEGKYSMYIDAVNRKMGPSSFCPDKQMVTIPDRRYIFPEAIEKAFASFKS